MDAGRPLDTGRVVLFYQISAPVGRYNCDSQRFNSDRSTENDLNHLRHPLLQRHLHCHRQRNTIIDYDRGIKIMRRSELDTHRQVNKNIYLI